MPLKIQTINDNTTNIVDITKTIIDLAQHPKKLPWTSAHPDRVFSDQFHTLFHRIDRSNNYFDNNISDIKKKSRFRNCQKSLILRNPLRRIAPRRFFRRIMRKFS